MIMKITWGQFAKEATMILTFYRNYIVALEFAPAKYPYRYARLIEHQTWLKAVKWISAHKRLCRELKPPQILPQALARQNKFMFWLRIAQEGFTHRSYWQWRLNIVSRGVQELCKNKTNKTIKLSSREQKVGNLKTPGKQMADWPWKIKFCAWRKTSHLLDATQWYVS